MEKNKQVVFKSLGLIDYKQAWDLQEVLFKNTVDSKLESKKQPNLPAKQTTNHLLFCEHPPVYTLGKSGKIENLLLNQENLEEKGAKFYKINRGGDITFHGPGQLVAYPILDLDNFFTDIHKYMRFLEEAVILTLHDFGIEAGRIDGLTGVWVDYIQQKNPRKICAMGVKASRWVTMHGLALNVNTDLRFFNYIVPCGIDDKAVTSMEFELGRKIQMSEVEFALKSHLSNLFEMNIIEE
ncbi:MAG: lipoyl(octanoyl) transferase LipB [Spirosomataceae bacterium]